MNEKKDDGLTYESRKLNLEKLGFASYLDYLESSLWRSIKDRVKAKHGKKCVLCGEDYSDMHHFRYGVDDLSGKTLDNIKPICRTCHDLIEYDGDRKRTPREASEVFRVLDKAEKQKNQRSGYLSRFAPYERNVANKKRQEKEQQDIRSRRKARQKLRKERKREERRLEDERKKKSLGEVNRQWLEMNKMKKPGQHVPPK